MWRFREISPQNFPSFTMSFILLMPL